MFLLVVVPSSRTSDQNEIIDTSNHKQQQLFVSNIGKEFMYLAVKWQPDFFPYEIEADRKKCS